MNNSKDKRPSLKVQEKNIGTLSPVAGPVPVADGPGSATAGGQTLISCPPALVSKGVDTLLLSFSADIPTDLLARLQESKQELQESLDSCQLQKFGNSILFAWNLQRMGKKFYPYVLKTGDVCLSLSTRKATSNIPSMQLAIGSISCNNGLRKTIKSFYRWCKHHNIVIKEEIVSRIDLYTDFNVSIETLRLWNQARFITKAEKFACYYSNRKITGVQAGSGDIVLRMYDKLQEMTDKQADHKLDFFKKVWKIDPDHITRVEFQLRREGIKSLLPEKNDYKATVRNLPKIWHYLTNNWFRQTAKAVDRLNRNQGKSTTSDFWQAVQAAFDAPNHAGLTRDRKQPTINIKALVDQATGIFQTVAAAVGHHHEDIFEIFATVRDLFQGKYTEIMSQKGYERDFYSRSVRAVVSF